MKFNGSLLRMVGKRRRDSDSMKRKPHFFKVLLGDFAQRLKMPPNFLKHISNEASKRATLEGPNGGSWRVELGESVNGTFLSTGWSKFVKDHSLKEHEFLVFRYNGNMHFSVQVFDTTACEREDLFTIEPRRKPKVCEGGNKRGRPAKHPLDVGFLLEHHEIKSGLTGHLTDDVHAPSQLQVYSSNSIQGSCVTSPSPSKDAKIKSEVEELPICMVGSNTKLRRGYFSRRRPVTTEERSGACEAANSFSSVFPSVILRMTNTNVYKTYMLRFPTSFSRAHLPRRRTNLILRDPNEKGWVVVYIPSQRDRLSGGWSAFARGNNLEEGDFCAFELIGPIEMRVHIFRVVKETTPLQISKM